MGVDNNVPWFSVYEDIYVTVMTQGDESWKELVKHLYAKGKNDFVIMSGRHGDSPNLIEEYTVTTYDADNKKYKEESINRLVGNVWGGGRDHVDMDKQVAKDIKSEEEFKDIVIEVQDTSYLPAYNSETGRCDGKPMDSRYNYHGHLKNAIATALDEKKVVIIAWCYSLMTFHELKQKDHDAVAHAWTKNNEIKTHEKLTANAQVLNGEGVFQHNTQIEARFNITHRCPIYSTYKEKMMCGKINVDGIDITNKYTVAQLAYHGFSDLVDYPKYVQTRSEWEDIQLEGVQKADRDEWLKQMPRFTQCDVEIMDKEAFKSHINKNRIVAMVPAANSYTAEVAVRVGQKIMSITDSKGQVTKFTDDWETQFDNADFDDAELALTLWLEYSDLPIDPEQSGDKTRRRRLIERLDRLSSPVCA